MSDLSLGVYEYLLAAYGSTMSSAAGITVITSKGWPVWGRPDATTPCAALELMGWLPGMNRIGQLVANGQTSYRGWLFARHEPELCALKGALVDWHSEHNAFEVAARRIACLLLEIKRHEPGSEAQQEQHAVTFLLQALW